MNFYHTMIGIKNEKKYFKTDTKWAGSKAKVIFRNTHRSQNKKYKPHTKIDGETTNFHPMMNSPLV